MTLNGRPTLLAARVAGVLLASTLACPATTARAQTAAQEERVAASFVLALGRTPTAVESERWTVLGPLSIADLLARHRRELQGDATARRAVADKAALDAFGRTSGDGSPGDRTGGGTYTDAMQRHLLWLAEHQSDYDPVVHRAYRVVLGRDAYSIELEYWKRQPVLSSALLVACVENWAVRNRPGLMATTGVASISVNSSYLSTVRLSPSVAAEARSAIGLTPATEPALASAVGRHVVAPGAALVASVGGVHFVAAGAASLAPTPGG
jgi:hypothetical protein